MEFGYKIHHYQLRGSLGVLNHREDFISSLDKDILKYLSPTMDWIMKDCGC